MNDYICVINKMSTAVALYDEVKDVCWVEGRKYRLSISMSSTERRRRRALYMKKYRQKKNLIQTRLLLDANANTIES